MTDTSSESEPRSGDDPSRPIALIACFGFLIASFLMLVPLPFEGRLEATLVDLGHAPMFGGITLAVLWLWQRFRPLSRFGRDWIGRLALVALCVFAFGIAIEIAQSLTGRKAAMHDVVANGLGIAAMTLTCFAVLRYRQGTPRKWPNYVAIVLASGCFIAAFVHPVTIAMDIYAVRRDFPLIASFESPIELTRWYFDGCRGTLAPENVTHGERAMRLSIAPVDYPSATLIETFSDWSDISQWQVDMTLDAEYGSPLQICLKVIDAEHRDYHSDVSRMWFELRPGKTTVLTFPRAEILDGPDGRKLQLSNIKYLSLLAAPPDRETHIDVDHLRVTKRVTPPATIR